MTYVPKNLLISLENVGSSFFVSVWYYCTYCFISYINWRMMVIYVYVKNMLRAYLYMWFRCTYIVLDFECIFILQNYWSKKEQEKIDVFLGTKRHPCYWAPCSHPSHHSQEAHGTCIIILQNKTENTCWSYEGINLWRLSLKNINSICSFSFVNLEVILLSWFCWWLSNKLFRHWNSESF